MWSPETQGCLLIHFSVVKFNFSQIIFLKKYSKHKFATILKLQFLDDSKNVNMPLNSYLTPSPKVYMQTLKSKPHVRAVHGQFLPLVTLQGPVSLQVPTERKCHWSM